MKKIPSVWVRDHSQRDAPYRDEVAPGCEWVLAGEGVATVKFDGTAVLIRGGQVFARFDAKHGKTPPPGFEPCQEPDLVTGHWPGWVPADRPQDRWIREAYVNTVSRLGALPDCTYEAIGPKIGANPEGAQEHHLLRHGVCVMEDAPRTFAALRDWLGPLNLEGLVFHHPDGRMAKVTKQGFGLPRRKAAA